MTKPLAPVSNINGPALLPSINGSTNTCDDDARMTGTSELESGSTVTVGVAIVGFSKILRPSFPRPLATPSAMNSCTPPFAPYSFVVRAYVTPHALVVQSSNVHKSSSPHTATASFFGVHAVASSVNSLVTRPPRSFIPILTTPSRASSSVRSRSVSSKCSFTHSCVAQYPLRVHALIVDASASSSSSACAYPLKSTSQHPPARPFARPLT
mmetsp:Transcript_1743/g.6868  ORF Transcript_1743/g.6868 Transcript_1743/m.6868 type:complete len:211 (+) Transcript_1743:2184-2816(+)